MADSCFVCGGGGWKGKRRKAGPVLRSRSVLPLSARLHSQNSRDDDLIETASALNLASEPLQHNVNVILTFFLKFT